MRPVDEGLLKQSVARDDPSGSALNRIPRPEDRRPIEQPARGHEWIIELGIEFRKRMIPVKLRRHKRRDRRCQCVSFHRSSPDSEWTGANRRKPNILCIAKCTAGGLRSM